MSRILACVAVVLLTARVFGADLAGGLAAYDRKDYETAARELLPLANEGNASAQARLAWMYRMGWAVPQDVARSYQMASSAAAKGDAMGQNVLGVLLLRGQGIQKDEAAAIRYFRLAAGQGYPGAYYNLGRRYEFGQAVPKDVAEALRLYRSAADKGHATAAANLGRLYLGGTEIPRNYGEALKWLRVAADKNDAEGLGLLGQAYMEGWGVPQDRRQAASYLRQATDLGDSRAQGLLGMAYEFGQGVSVNKAEAARLYRLSSDQNDPDGQGLLAGLLLNAEGVPQNCAEALRLARLAAAQGAPSGESVLGNAAFYGVCTSQSYADARSWYEKAAAQGGITASINLGYMYVRGYGGLPQDLAAAEKLLVPVAERGSATAQSRLRTLRAIRAAPKTATPSAGSSPGATSPRDLWQALRAGDAPGVKTWACRSDARNTIDSASSLYPIVYAAQLNREDLVAALLDCGTAADPEWGNFSPLNIALEHANYRMADMLVAHGANVNLVKSWNEERSPLYSVVRRHDAVGLIFLLARGANPNQAPKDRETPLLAAVRMARTDERARDVRDRLAASGLTRAPANVRQTLLTEAVLDQDLTLATLCLNAGTDPNTTSSTKGWTPLLLAARDGSGEVADLLLARGADRKLVNHFGMNYDAVVEARQAGLWIPLQAIERELRAARYDPRESPFANARSSVGELLEATHRAGDARSSDELTEALSDGAAAVARAQQIEAANAVMRQQSAEDAARAIARARQVASEWLSEPGTGRAARFSKYFKTVFDSYRVAFPQ